MGEKKSSANHYLPVIGILGLRGEAFGLEKTHRGRLGLVPVLEREAPGLLVGGNLALTLEDLCQPAPSPKGRIAPPNFPAVQEKQKSQSSLNSDFPLYMYRELTLENFFRRKGRDKLSVASGINVATHRGLDEGRHMLAASLISAHTLTE
jgi:hypothetical protein